MKKEAIIIIFIMVCFAVYSFLKFDAVDSELLGIAEEVEVTKIELQTYNTLSNELLLYKKIEDIWFDKASEFLSHEEVRELSLLTYRYHNKYGSNGDYPIGLDYWKIFSIIAVESNFNPLVESYAGAVGLMQIMPLTAVGVLENSFELKGLTRIQVFDYLKNPVMNFRIGIEYLITLQRRYIVFGYASKNDWKLAFTKFNWGNLAVSNLIQAVDKGTPKASLRYALSVEKRYEEYK